MLASPTTSPSLRVTLITVSSQTWILVLWTGSTTETSSATTDLISIRDLGLDMDVMTTVTEIVSNIVVTSLNILNSGQWSKRTAIAYLWLYLGFYQVILIKVIYH